MAKAIKVCDLNYDYEDGTAAIQGVSFFAEQGCTLGIIGANGAGKTTLIMLLCGLLAPKSGQIFVGDILLKKENLKEARRRLGVVLQDPDNQLFMPTVWEDVAFGPRNLGLSEDEVKSRVDDTLLSLNISHLAQKAPFKLSSGEKRTAAIAAALSSHPDTMIFDEPTCNMDPAMRRRFIELLGSFKHTKIITGHDMDAIYEMCGKVIILDKGKIAGDETMLLKRDFMTSVGLDIPLAFQGCGGKNI